MKLVLRKIILLGILVVGACLYTGCATADKVYDSVNSLDATDEELRLLTEGKLGVVAEGMEEVDLSDAGSFVNGLGKAFFTMVCQRSKQYGWIVCVGSFFIGFIMLRLAPRSMRAKKTAIFLFMIGIPALTIMVIYASAFFADTFY